LILKLLGPLSLLFHFNSSGPMSADNITDVFSIRTNWKLKSWIHNPLKVRLMKEGNIVFQHVVCQDILQWSQSIRILL
jgi:hypothetical protein